jgi:hypothetical protein
MKNKLNEEFEAFYDQCLAELKSRPNFSEAYLPMLERYVLISMKAAKLGTDIVDDEVTVDHTNKVKATNQATSPKWRMFILLNKEASALARELKLSPVSAPPKAAAKKEKKGFDLKMKVAR